MLCVSGGAALAAGDSLFAAAEAVAFGAAGFAVGFDADFAAAGAALSPRAIANISATLGRAPPTAFFTAAGAGALAGSDAAAGALADGSPDLLSAVRTAAKISATVILLLSAISQ